MERFAGMTRKDIHRRVGQTRLAAKFMDLFNDIKKDLTRHDSQAAILEAAKFLWRTEFVGELRKSLQERQIKLLGEPKEKSTPEYVIAVWPVEIQGTRKFLTFGFVLVEESEIQFQVALVDEPTAKALEKNNPDLLVQVFISDAGVAHPQGSDILEEKYSKVVSKALDRALERAAA